MNYVTVRRPMTVAGNDGSVLDSFDRLFSSVFANTPGWDTFKPAVDVRVEEKEYLVEVDLPGISEDQIDVHVEDGLLVIASRKEERNVARKEENQEESRYVLRERRVGEFHRSFSLPKDADPENIQATYRNGVLSVALPKKPEAKPRQIKITRG
ncbi:HSP20 family protein [Alkalispirochaeta americana]|uniref:HSP20 family protein n=1 Tax=Alkalispirochaeta americana TaxID=159291 RepID=A0A1N6RAG7_9SPIO|nr:Hsp20/alpha crystallin family protein [Alkalispirochaeta americana]SIQ25849.1 HSP20 family protein [Alkalispirochaeta americana]